MLRRTNVLRIRLTITYLKDTQIAIIKNNTRITYWFHSSFYYNVKTIRNRKKKFFNLIKKIDLLELYVEIQRFRHGTDKKRHSTIVKDVFWLKKKFTNRWFDMCYCSKAKSSLRRGRILIGRGPKPRIQSLLTFCCCRR